MSILSDKFKRFNELHRQKARSLIILTEPGMAMFANELHSMKVPLPMAVTEFGMATFANELQYLCCKGVWCGGGRFTTIT